MWHDGYPSRNGGRPLPPNNWVRLLLEATLYGMAYIMTNILQQSVFNVRAWKWNDDREQYYLHQFTPEQPDLNYREQRVVQAMKDVLTFWLDKGADGFRIDAVNHLFEDPAMRDEPLTGDTNDPSNYGYTKHIYTKDMVRLDDDGNVFFFFHHKGN